MRWRVALLFVFVILVSAGCLGTADETETPPYGENATFAEIVEGHDENEFQGYRYTYSIRDIDDDELLLESTVSIDYADGEILVEEDDIDDNVSGTSYVNISSGVRYGRKLYSDGTYSEPGPEKVDADEGVEKLSIPGIFSPLPANETRLTLEKTEEENAFRYSADSVVAGRGEVTNVSVSLTAEGFIQGFSSTSDGAEYTAEVEERGDIDVEMPDWVDTDETPRSFGAVSVKQNPGEIRFVLVDPGSLDKVRLEGPGGASLSHEDLTQAGLNIRVSDGGFSGEEIDIDFVKPNNDECIIQHSKSEVAGQTVSVADIPCDGSGIDGLEGDDIRYKTGAEYRIVGVVDGEEAVVETVTTEQE